MERWAGRVAVVTGASAGIGEQITIALVRAGLIVVGVARRTEKIRELAATLRDAKGKLHALHCDLTKEEDILKVFEWVEKELGGVDVLINNAGILFLEPIIGGKTEHYRGIMDVNVIAPAICTRETVKSIQKRNAEGHIININSYAGHYAENVRFPLSLYVASKYALNGMTHSLRFEIASARLNIKVTSVSPGAVDTDILKNVMPDEVLKDFGLLSSKDIADSVIHALSTPPGVQVYELIVMPYKGAEEMSQIEKMSGITALSPQK